MTRDTAERIVESLVKAGYIKPFDADFIRLRLDVAIDAARADGERAGLEKAAKVAETFPSEVVQFYPRGPNSPPGNMVRPSTPADIAAAIRAIPEGEGC